MEEVLQECTRQHPLAGWEYPTKLKVNISTVEFIVKAQKNAGVGMTLEQYEVVADLFEKWKLQEQTSGLPQGVLTGWAQCYEEKLKGPMGQALKSFGEQNAIVGAITHDQPNKKPKVM